MQITLNFSGDLPNTLASPALKKFADILEAKKV